MKIIDKKTYISKRLSLFLLFLILYDSVGKLALSQITIQNINYVFVIFFLNIFFYITWIYGIIATVKLRKSPYKIIDYRDFYKSKEK